MIGKRSFYANKQEREDTLTDRKMERHFHPRCYFRPEIFNVWIYSKVKLYFIFLLLYLKGKWKDGGRVREVCTWGTYIEFPSSARHYRSTQCNPGTHSEFLTWIRCPRSIQCKVKWHRYTKYLGLQTSHNWEPILALKVRKASSSKHHIVRIQN